MNEIGVLLVVAYMTIAVSVGLYQSQREGFIMGWSFGMIWFILVLVWIGDRISRLFEGLRNRD